MKFKCVKSVFVHPTKEQCFTEGKVYESDENEKFEGRYWSIDDQGMNHGLSKEFFDRHFVMIEEKIKHWMVEFVYDSSTCPHLINNKEEFGDEVPMCRYHILARHDKTDCAYENCPAKVKSEGSHYEPA